MDDRSSAPQEIVAAAVAAPWGPVHLAASADGVVAVALATTAEAFEAELARRRRGAAIRWVRLEERPDHPERAADPRGSGRGDAAGDVPALRHLRAAAAALEAREAETNARHVAKRPAAGPADSIVLDLSDRPAWDRAVLEAVRAIPRGEVRSYGQIARAVDRPGAARAVGGAVGRNPVALLVPCHRVVAGDGTLGRYGGGWWGDHERLLDLKAKLLAGEGVHLPRSHSRGSRSG